VLKDRISETIPALFPRWLAARWPGAAHSGPAEAIQFGALRRLRPISREFGYDRGQPIDRYYIENFLARQAPDIRGCVLEVGDDSYTRRFGGTRVTAREVLHVNAGHPAATIVGDLTHADHIPANTFDCFILTQTLHLIYDVQLALRTVYRILKPRGIVLATLPGVSQISHDEWAKDWYWSFTVAAILRLFTEVFPAADVTVESYGNVLAAAAFLQGLAATELSPTELEYRDPNCQLLITVRAEKPGGKP
jgi:SAM-dependent methyltransferase